MVNSGRCSSPRSRLRNTRANSKIVRLARRQQLLAGEFRRGVQIKRQRARRRGPISSVAKACRWVSLPGETCRRGGLDLDESLRLEPAPHALGDLPALEQKRPPVGMAVRRPTTAKA